MHCLEARLARARCHRIERRADVVTAAAALERRGERGQGARGHVVRGEPRVEQVGRAEARARQRQVWPQPARKRGEEVGGADVGEEADVCLGHRKQRLLGRDAELPVHRQPSAATHANTVPDGHLRLVRGCQRRVERVLLPEEGVRDVAARWRLLLGGEHHRLHVSAGAEGLAFAGQQEAPHGGVGAGVLERSLQLPDHLEVERVERTGSLQRNRRQRTTTLAGDVGLRGFGHHAAREVAHRNSRR
mmetsp:Transcript_43455/g.140937  ORF Transcript_43455/g.140937 Transcript_43455/m.140937 type:complete len:246 (-) Transcript_43455:13-750(-)